jgi:hypothetical protein
MLIRGQILTRALVLCFWAVATSPFWAVWGWAIYELASLEAFKALWGIFALCGLMLVLGWIWLAESCSKQILQKGKSFKAALLQTMSDVQARLALLSPSKPSTSPAAAAPPAQPPAAVPAPEFSVPQPKTTALPEPAGIPDATAPLEAPALHFLRAAEGWIGLGDYLSAKAELDHLPPVAGGHPDVLSVRWQISANAKQWAVCLYLARTLTRLAPDRGAAWIQQAISLHKLGRTREAKVSMLAVATRFGEDTAFTYHLARFCGELNETNEARDWLKRARTTALERGEINQLRDRALGQPQLAQVWRDLESGTESP